MFDPKEYVNTITQATEFIKTKLPAGFKPKVCLTLGSGGLGEIAALISQVAEPIPYADIPGFTATSVVGHEGQLLAGQIAGVPVLGLKGRKHYYEFGGEPSVVEALKMMTFPVYVARNLGAEVYFATNAAGGLAANQKPGDLMIITSHNGLFFPNALQGPLVDFMGAVRFQPQNTQYDVKYSALLKQAAETCGEAEHLSEGVYAALTGPTYESRAESQALRLLGAQAMGMSTVPEIQVASNIGMQTVAFSLITNVIAADGTNATSHEEVMATLQDPKTKARILQVTKGFFELLANQS